jgi:hypothetical protein
MYASVCAYMQGWIEEGGGEGRVLVDGRCGGGRDGGGGRMLVVERARSFPSFQGAPRSQKPRMLSALARAVVPAPHPDVDAVPPPRTTSTRPRCSRTATPGSNERARRPKASKGHHRASMV